MSNRFRSYLHVIIQFSCLFYLLFASHFSYDILPSIFVGLGVIIGVWSVWVMRKSVLTIFPDPSPNISLIQKGPYKYIRHPMYTALFIFLITLVIDDFSWLHLVLFLLFGFNLIYKLKFEEELLLQKIPEYADYKTKSWRLIPLFY
jgi:protein-S-isoprenylcysteine O-methyltransferase Ste14